MSEEIVVVETISGMMEAEILRGLLESMNISVCLSHESAGKIYALGVGRLGRVDMMVPADQADEARRIIADYHAGRFIDKDEPSID
jgi:hypothetical protein